MNAEELEILRKKVNDIWLKGILGTVAGVILILISGLNASLLIFVILIGVFGTMTVAIGPAKEFRLAFKNTFVLKSLQSVFTDLVYRPDEGLDSSIIRDTGMMYMGDRYSSNDYVAGKYKNVGVVQADVHIEEKCERKDEDGKTEIYWETMFSGRWLIFDFNKRFRSSIQVRQKGFGNARLKKSDAGIEYKKVMFEDQAFNDSFSTYAYEELDAFYVLTPPLMEKIKKLANNMNGSLLFCFIDDKLHIGVQNSRDAFEHGTSTKVDEEKIMRTISQDIKLITDFIDGLNLDNDLFKKEM